MLFVLTNQPDPPLGFFLDLRSLSFADAFVFDFFFGEAIIFLVFFWRVRAASSGQLELLTAEDYRMGCRPTECPGGFPRAEILECDPCPGRSRFLEGSHVIRITRRVNTCIRLRFSCCGSTVAGGTVRHDQNDFGAMGSTPNLPMI